MQTETAPDRMGQLLHCIHLISRMYRSRPDHYYYRMMYDYYTDLRDARSNGKKVIAHTIFFPVEILQAMDVVPLHLEFTGAMMSLFGVSVPELLAEAGAMGLAPEICSAHRLVGGALKFGALPEADGVVCSNMVCDNSIKSGEAAMRFNRCPGFEFDYPFNPGQAADRFVIEELKQAIAFLEEVSGNRMDWDKLSENVAETSKQIGLIRQINEQCKSVPSPFQPQDFLKLLMVDYMGAGRKEATIYLENLRDHMAAMTAEGRGFVSPERLRLMELMLSPWYLQGAIDNILAEHGTAIVCNPNLSDWRGELELDPEKPLESIALKLAKCAPMRMFGPLDERAIDPVLSSISEYKIDGAINFTHLGCRQLGPTLKVYRDILAEASIPLLNIDCDLIDSTVTSGDDVRQQLEQFFEILEDL